MTADPFVLSRRLLSLKRWAWKPGMADHLGNRCTYVVDGVPHFGDRFDCSEPGWPDPEAVPDLTDGLTVQALLLLVREAWGEPLAVVAPYCGRDLEHVLADEDDGSLIDGWMIPAISRANVTGSTEAEALVAALECAP